MKYIFLSALFLFAVLKNGHSQIMVSSNEAKLTFANGRPEVKSPIDTAKLLITYTYSHIVDTVKKQTFQDRFMLEIGNRHSRFYSLFAEKSDSNMYVFSNSPSGRRVDAATNPRKFLKENERDNYDSYWFDYPNQGELFVHNLIVNQPYSYTEPIPVFDWEFFPDTMNILGYVCQLARTSFRGRNYEAWFTLEIPISKGPWKFSGLPGLILKVQTDCRDFSFETIGIQVPQSVHPIYRYRYLYREITREEMFRLYRMSYQDPAGLVMAHGWVYAGRDANGRFRQFESGERVFPYVPFLELE